MKIIPCLDRVVVRRTKSAEKSTGGIIIPESAQDNTAPEGMVIAVGPGRTSEQGVLFPPYVKVGDRVLFSKYAGLEARPYDHTKVKGDDDLLVMRCDEIHAIIVEDTKES